MIHKKRDILFKYFTEKDKLDFCLEVIERGFKSVEKVAYYENFSHQVVQNLTAMEDENPFLLEINKIMLND